MTKLLTVIGTRPEALKLTPLLKELSTRPHFESEILLSRQHDDLVELPLAAAGLSPHYRLPPLPREASLHTSASHILSAMAPSLRSIQPDLVIVQGDTTTTFAAALAAFYSQIPVAHVEAGLRTGCLNSPWPEEAHRCLIGRLATYAFAPTTTAREALLAEGVPPDRIWVVGNTAVDALNQTLKGRPKRDGCEQLVTITVHRRENQGAALPNICHAIKQIARERVHTRFEWVLHPNPAVHQPVQKHLSQTQRVSLCPPLSHRKFLELLDQSTLVITDSGGIQEEACYLGKPVLVVRDSTERGEGVSAGTSRLVGTSPEALHRACHEILDDTSLLRRMSRVHHPYGTGGASKAIADILGEELIR